MQVSPAKLKAGNEQVGAGALTSSPSDSDFLDFREDEDEKIAKIRTRVKEVLLGSSSETTSAQLLAQLEVEIARFKRIDAGLVDQARKRSAKGKRSPLGRSLMSAGGAVTVQRKKRRRSLGHVPLRNGHDVMELFNASENGLSALVKSYKGTNLIERSRIWAEGVSRWQ